MWKKLMVAGGWCLAASVVHAAVASGDRSPAAREFKPGFVTPRPATAPAEPAAAPAKLLPPPVALSAAQVVDRNVAARGGLKAWRNVGSLTMTGVLDAGGKPNVELPYVMRVKRGHKSRLELRFQEQTALQVFDGREGWKVRPFLNRNEVEPFTAVETKSAMAWDEFDGPLIDHAAKGIKVEAAGTEVLEGRNTYRLRLTNAGGAQRTVWIDAETFLETRIEGEPRRLDGKARKVFVYYRDFRAEAGITTPRLLETVVEGIKPTRKLTVARLSVNEAMPDTLFAKPDLRVAVAQGPAQPTK